MSSSSTIERAVRAILETVPPHVTVVGAVKTRSAAEVEAALGAGLRHIGHNYVQEASAMWDAAPWRASAVWHGIGHLQTRKAKKAVEIFSWVESVDSLRVATALHEAALAQGKVISVLVEVNAGQEDAKDGLHPDEVTPLLRAIAPLTGISVHGLMTLGPASGDVAALRAAFRLTRELWEESRAIDGVAMTHLSMGMSSSWELAIEEGANVIRLGTALFGARPAKEA